MCIPEVKSLGKWMLHQKAYGYGHKEITAVVFCVEDTNLQLTYI